MDPSLIIAGLALVVSAFVCLIHYRNQAERRHGEIVQLRSQILTALSNQQQRFTSTLLHGESLRLELRRIPDSDSKYTYIERLPPILAKASELKAKAEKFIREFEAIETQAHNTTATLLRLQQAAATFERTTPTVQSVEDDMLELLRDIRQQTKA